MKQPTSNNPNVSLRKEY